MMIFNHTFTAADIMDYMKRHDAIDAHAAQAHAEGKRLVQETITEINNQIGFWIRSEGQIRRYERAKKK